MKLISLNVGLPREVLYRGKPVSTGIYKTPVEGRVRLRTLNLDGDQQADLKVHGGVYKAVYAYPSEHYATWAAELGRADLAWGQFGENFTTEGLLETEVYIGDVFRIGSALVQVTQPRLPCFKLGIKMGSQTFQRRFIEAGRPGFCLRVLEEGEIGAGDVIEQVSRDPQRVGVWDVNNLYFNDRANVELLRRALRVEALPPGWVESFTEFLLKQQES